MGGLLRCRPLQPSQDPNRPGLCRNFALVPKQCAPDQNRDGAIDNQAGVSDGGESPYPGGLKSGRGSRSVWQSVLPTNLTFREMYVLFVCPESVSVAGSFEPFQPRFGHTCGAGRM